MKKVVILILAVFLSGCARKSTKNTVQPTPEMLIYPKTATPFVIRVNGVDYGQFGRQVITNAGTPDQLTYIGYFVPGGIYKAQTNRNAFQDQISILSPATEWVNGYEYPAGADAVVVKPGETISFFVPEGWYVKVVPPSDITIFK